MSTILCEEKGLVQRNATSSLSCMPIFEWRSVKINLRGFQHKSVTLSVMNTSDAREGDYSVGSLSEPQLS